jgi:hypothetical protein
MNVVGRQSIENDTFRISNISLMSPISKLFGPY